MTDNPTNCSETQFQLDNGTCKDCVGTGSQQKAKQTEGGMSCRCVDMGYQWIAPTDNQDGQCKQCAGREFYEIESGMCFTCPEEATLSKSNSHLQYYDNCTCPVNQELAQKQNTEELMCVCDDKSINVAQAGQNISCKQCSDTINNGLNIQSSKFENSCLCDGDALFNQTDFSCYCNTTYYFDGANCRKCPAFTSQTENDVRQCKCYSNQDFIAGDPAKCGCTGNKWLNTTPPEDTMNQQCVECPQYSVVTENGTWCDSGDGREFDPISGTFIGDPPYANKGGLSAGAVAGIVVAIIIIITGIGLALGFTLKKKVDKEAQLRDMFEMKKPQMGVGML